MVTHSWNEYTFADYVALETLFDGDTKHEFINGEIMAMTGGSPRHAVLGAEMVSQLSAQAQSPCRVFSADLWIGSLETDMTTYADASIVCGPLEPHPEESRVTVNPMLVAEVTSPSSERKDRGPKLAHYQGMRSVMTVVIVSHRERRVDVHRRIEGYWRLSSEATGWISVTDGITLNVDRLYETAEGL